MNYIESRFSNDTPEPTLSEQYYDSKIWKKDREQSKEDSFGYKPKNDLNKKNEKIIKNNNKNNENPFSNFENNNLSSSMNISSIPKKLPFSLQSKPYGFMNKKINMKSNVNMNNNIYNNNRQFTINHNLSKYAQKKNKENVSLFDKIKDKVTKEKIESKQNSISKKIIQKEEKSNNNSKNSKKSEEISNDEAKFNDNFLDKEIDENDNKKESNDDDEDILSEEVDEMEEGGNIINSINKINSINVHSNFIKTHYYTGSGFSINSNNSSSHNSSCKQKCYTEPDEFSIYPQTFLNPPSSGRSNYSGNTAIAPPPMILKRGGAENHTKLFHGLYHPNNTFSYQYKNSFLSTNTNSHNQSGYKIDSSLSNESGQSPHYLGKYQKLQYNNSMTNIKNNTFIFPFPSNLTPINRNIYTSQFNSNENLFKQPFSLNTKTYTNNYNNYKREKQIIKLEDVALGKETRTTIMIRNIPIKYSDDNLEIELKQFEGKYDCLYMPFDYEKGGNKGYAFLNLKSPYHVLYFYEIFNNKCWLFFESKKICQLNYAIFQGIEEIKKHANNYKGAKKPRFYISTNDDNNKIEIPYKYLNIFLKAYPNIKYIDNKQKNVFIVESFN